MIVNNCSDDDVTCKMLDWDDKFLFMEGKESACLPQRLCTDGHHLCSFGFASKVARIKWKPPPAANSSETPDWHGQAERDSNLGSQLQTYLNSSGDDKKIAETTVRPSKRTTAILRDNGKIATAKDIVHTKFDAGMIQPGDPVNLWVAVMQASHYTVSNGRTMTIVQSARLWWFVQLDMSTSIEDGGGDCVVRLSMARKVGDKNFLYTVMRFLFYAHASPKMDESSRRKWEKALCTEVKHRASTGNKEQNDVSSGEKDSKRPRQSLTSSTGTGKDAPPLFSC